MADESVKAAFARLLGTLGDAAPILRRLADDMYAAVDAVVASEERKEAFSRAAIAQLKQECEPPVPEPHASTTLAAVLPSPPERPADEESDPYIEQDPRAWLEKHGAKGSMKAMRLSECPSEYLDMLAEGLDTRAKHWDKKNESAKAAADRKLARYALQHAARLKPAPKHTPEHRTISADDVLGIRP